MSNLLQSGLQWLGGVMKNFTTQPISIMGNGWAIAGIQATIGPSERVIDNGVEMVGMIINEELFFTVTASDLVLNGRTFKPERGQRIRAIIGGNERFYEVHPNNGLDAWSWVDSAKIRIRILAKEIGKPT